MEINHEKIESMMESLEKYPGVLPLHVFYWELSWLSRDVENSGGFVAYMENLESTGLFEELYDELYEERRRNNRLPYDQLDGTIVEWVDKLSNHPELLSDAEREWVKNNPEYKEIVIQEGE